MPKGRYRVTSPTIALFVEEDRHVARTISAGTIISIPDGKVFDGEKLMEVVWDGRTVMMFAQDLRSRTVAIE